MSTVNTQVKLQVPMDKDVLEGLKRRAEALGFDSAQALIRVWAKAEVDGRELSFGDDWGQPSPEAAARLNKAAEEAKRGIGVSRPFHTAKRALDYLHNLKGEDLDEGN